MSHYGSYYGSPEETSDIFRLGYKYIAFHRPADKSLNVNANVFGGLNLARAVLPGMRAREEGTILWNGSFTGWQPGTGIGLYSATKATRLCRGARPWWLAEITDHLQTLIESNIAGLTRGDIVLRPS